jgi:hypothetical protein
MIALAITFDVYNMDIAAIPISFITVLPCRKFAAR